MLCSSICNDGTNSHCKVPSSAELRAQEGYLVRSEFLFDRLQERNPIRWAGEALALGERMRVFSEARLVPYCRYPCFISSLFECAYEAIDEDAYAKLVSS